MSQKQSRSQRQRQHAGAAPAPASITSTPATSAPGDDAARVHSERVRSGRVSAVPRRRRTDLQPSTFTADFWLWIERGPDATPYPESTKYVGKWMVFVPVAHVDAWWAKIKHAVATGQLGDAAKVATARPNPNAISERQRVICVYTYDGVNDRDDAMRVRAVLRALGVTWPISYKLDSATLAGVYSRNGGKVSLYRE